MVIRLSGITKRFRALDADSDDVLANDGIDLELRRGEVHCLLGENGSGKSTLISMLAGMQQPDAGQLEIDGARTVLRSPTTAKQHGIGVVHQHSTLIPTMSVLENLMLGEPGRGRGRLRLDRVGARARLEQLSQVLGASIDPDAPVSDLGLGQRQQLEIAKALGAGDSIHRGAAGSGSAPTAGMRCLVLDEPTSMLTPQGVDALLAGVRALVADGLAVLFVTHKLHEAHLLGDRVTVLRRGRAVAGIEPRELAALSEEAAAARMFAAMFGGEDRDVAPSPCVSDSESQDLDPVGASLASTRSAGGEFPVASTGSGDGSAVVLQIEGVSTAVTPGAETGGSEAGGTPVRGISFEIRAGEMLGIAGIDGHGQRHLAEVIAGQRSCASGRILLDGRAIERTGVRERRRLGVRYVTDDRLGEGIVGGLSVALNLLLKQIGERPFWRRGRMDRAAVRRHAEQRIDAYDIRPPAPGAPAATLSGGNIQKLLLARELADAPRMVVVNKPTYGLDLKTVERVHGILRGFVRGDDAYPAGAVLLISSDLDELVALCGRIAVMSGGRLVGTVLNDGDRVPEQIGELMVGAAHPGVGE